MQIWLFKHARPNTHLVSSASQVKHVIFVTHHNTLTSHTTFVTCHISHPSHCRKGQFLYSAVSSPQDGSKRFTLYSLTDLFTQTIFRLFREASSHTLQLMCEGCSYIYPPLFIVRYSFIQLSELEQCRVKKLAQGVNTAAQDSNPRSRSRDSEALPLSHCARIALTSHTTLVTRHISHSSHCNTVTHHTRHTSYFSLVTLH